MRGYLALAGIVIGGIALRRIRKRKSSPADEPSNPEPDDETPTEVAREEFMEAADHAAAAIEHARIAGENAVEAGRQRLDQ